MANLVRRLDEAEGKIKREEAFYNQGRAFWAGTGGARSTGSLPPRYHDAARRARYVVYSYRTPIGWVTQEGERVVPDVGYSDTTSQHQYTVLHAWEIRRFPARGREVRRAGGGPRRGGIDDQH